MRAIEEILFHLRDCVRMVFKNSPVARPSTKPPPYLDPPTTPLFVASVPTIRGHIASIQGIRRVLVSIHGCCNNCFEKLLLGGSGGLSKYTYNLGGPPAL